jgi:hypothetical protein
MPIQRRVNRRGKQSLRRKSFNFEGLRTPEEISSWPCSLTSKTIRQPRRLGCFGIEERTDWNAGSFCKRLQDRSGDLFVGGNVHHDRLDPALIASVQRNQ